jgi:hypothetical protein
MRVLLEEVRVLARNLAYHRRARLEDFVGQTLDEVDSQIEELTSVFTSTEPRPGSRSDRSS